jgi:hypothetical protein
MILLTHFSSKLVDEAKTPESETYQFHLEPIPPFLIPIKNYKLHLFQPFQLGRYVFIIFEESYFKTLF